MPDSDVKRVETPKRFRSIQGVRRFVAQVLARLDNEDEEGFAADRARVMIYGAKVLADLIEGSVLERRIQALERVRQQHGEQTHQ